MTRQNKVGTHATSIYTGLGITNIQYHGTKVVRFDAETITLDSGGWRTATTKTRMNQAARQFDLEFQVYQKDFEWFVDLPDGRIVEFIDGLTFSR